MSVAPMLFAVLVVSGVALVLSACGGGEAQHNKKSMLVPISPRSTCRTYKHAMESETAEILP